MRMNMPELRKLILQRPFRPVKIRIRAGDPLIVRHPDFIRTFGNDEESRWIAVTDGPDGPPVVYEVGEVVSITYIKNGNARRHKSQDTRHKTLGTRPYR